MARPAASNDDRKARYRQLRTLGFSRNEATKLRDHRIEGIKIEVEKRGGELEKIPAKRRTEKQREALKNYRAYKRTPEKVERRLSNKRSRLDAFSEWTKEKNFPPQYLDLILEYNEQGGYSENDSFGYRKFFHRYVNGMSENEAERWVDSHDT